MDKIMEKKLAEYRLKKEREEQPTETKRTLKNIFSLIKADRGTKDIITTSKPEEELKEPLLDAQSTVSDTEEIEEIDDENCDCLSYVDLVYYGLCFLLWATVYAIFIKLGFGAIYVIVSGILGMYFNTRTGKRKKNEVSAYSVFNRNCESIDGALKAEQFERELYYGGR